MVGFGSAFRLTRRKGWESAYIDYESLKMLLTQIEAVYEENNCTTSISNEFGHTNSMNDAGSLGFYATGGGIHGFGTATRTGGEDNNSFDYDYAFGGMDALDEEEDDYNLMAYGTSASRRRQKKGRGHSKRSTSSGEVGTKRQKKQMKMDFRDELFLESDSSAAFASSEYESEEDEDDYDNDQHQDGHHDHGRHYNSNHYQQKSNHVEKTHRYQTSLDSAPFSYDHGIPNYGSYGGSSNGSVMSGGSKSSFEHHGHHHNPHQHHHETEPILSPIDSVQRGFGIPSSQQQQRGDMRRNVGKTIRNDSRLNYMRRMRHRRRRLRSTKVPLHLRRAHLKARAITERFLGLMKAEVDKVMLFTHSHMGELTNTIGSLRFPSEDHTEYVYGGNYNDHQLSDGGIHPSASSSSEEWLSTEEDEPGHNNKHGSPPGYQRRHGSDRRGRTRHEKTNFLPDPVLAAIKRDRNIRLDDDAICSSTHRQLRLCEKLRISRPNFQRSDEILGEDFLLLSAVDEADAFTAIGVEFMHLLRFVCVNVIAIRKLCKKHDRLLANRMLGGYYHRLNPKPNPLKGRFCNGRSDGGFTRGSENIKTPKRKNVKKRAGRIGRRLYSSSMRRTVSRSHRGNYMLVGNYDAQIQRLCNSSVALTLTESLCSALREFDESKERANALSTIRDPHLKAQMALSSEDSLVSAAFGGGLCDQFPAPKVFGFSSPPRDAIQRLSSSQHGSEDDEKSDAPSTSSTVSLIRLRFVVASVLKLRNAAAEKRNLTHEYFSRSLLAMDHDIFIGEPQGLNGCSRDTLDFFVSYNPDYALVLDSHVLQTALSGGDAFDALSAYSSPQSMMTKLQNQSIPVETSDHKAMFYLNIISVALSTMNYYIIFPSAGIYCHALDQSYVYSAILIGCANISASIAVSYHAYYLERFKTQEWNLRKLLILTCIFPFLGNLLYARSYEYGFLSTAIIGRILIGFSSAEIINKQLVVSYKTKDESVKEMAKLRLTQILSVFVSMLLGSIQFDEWQIELSCGILTLNYLTIPSYLIAFAWICLLLSLAFCSFPHHVKCQVESAGDIKADPSLSPSEHESHSHHPLEKAFLFRSGSDWTVADGDTSLVESVESSRNGKVGRDEHEVSVHISKTLSRTWKLVVQNFALSATILLHGVVSLSMELLLTSCVIITHRYFDWSAGNTACFLLFLAVLILPTHLFTVHNSTKYGERCVMKKTLILMIFSILTLVNYQALGEFLFVDVPDIFRKEVPNRNENRPTQKGYDWGMGSALYSISVAVIFVCSTSLEGLGLSLMSKVSSKKSNRSPINCSVIAPLVSLLGKILGDTVVAFAGFSHFINTDMVNLICLVLVGLYFCCLHVVKKHYFFLNGV